MIEPDVLAPAGTLEKYTISTEVNSPRNDGPQILTPVEIGPALEDQRLPIL